MFSWRIRSRRAWIVPVIVCGAALVAGVTYAAIPDSAGVIHGCYLNAQGHLRVIDTGKGEHCTQAETALNWNQTGPKGATGVTGAHGPAGATGPVGPQGAPGLGAPQYIAANLTSPVADPSDPSNTSQKVDKDFGVFNGIDVKFECYSFNNGGDVNRSGATLLLRAVNGVEGDTEG